MTAYKNANIIDYQKYTESSQLYRPDSYRKESKKK